MIFWHTAGAIWGARYIFRDPGMDLRWLVFGGLLPDLIDKPLAWFVVPGYQTSRLWAHSLLFAALLLAVIVMFTGRGTANRKRFIPVAIGVLMHLVLDVPFESETLWWPFLGTDFPPFEFFGFDNLMAYLSRSPWILVQEALGVGYLVYLWRRYELSIPANFTRLRRSGQLGLSVQPHGGNHE
ncbi:MAG: hypothetical protein HKO10_02325 [Acidimicrobiia bacterium]|nr:hypothetical protein [Acidimicrobiia bacterium]